MSELEPLSPDLKALFGAERGYEAESDERRTRVMNRLASTAAAVGVVSVVGAGVAHAASSATSATWLARLARIARTKAAIAVGALAIGGAGGGAVGHRLGEEAAEKRAAAVASTTITTPVLLPVPAPLPAPSASSIDVLALPSSVPSSIPAPRPHVAPRETGDDDLASELAFVQMARTALARQNYSAALDATDQHARKFPNGHLAEERESLAIQALVGGGRDADARARAARFRAKYPHSLLLPAVEAAVRPN
ncbi:MAG: hypothetical protein ABIP89_22290 [Polyangiaceae bacterium]